MIENCMYYFKESRFSSTNILFPPLIALSVFETISYEESETMYLSLKEDLFLVILNLDPRKNYCILLPFFTYIFLDKVYQK